MAHIESRGEKNLASLEASERQYRRLFEAAKDGILILNSANAKIEDVNPFLVDLLGYSREELIGKEIWEVGPFRDVAASIADFRELQAKEYIRYEDLPLQKRNGGLVSVEFVSNVYAVNGGNVIQCNIRDITLRKQMVDELRRAKENAEQANESKNRFISMLGHELRTPLNPVMMVIHAWKTEKLLPPALLPDLEIIQRCVQIQAKLIDDLLDVTAITHGKFKLEFRPQDAHELLRYAVETTQAQIIERQIEVVISLNAGNSIVSTDSTRLAQVFWNLIQNAVKFTPCGGKITISTANEGKRIRVDIGDTGIGIPVEAMGEIFNAFEQGPHGRLYGGGGLGLGLTIARSLIELLGGSISVQSEGSGRGSLFTVMLETAEL